MSATAEPSSFPPPPPRKAGRGECRGRGCGDASLPSSKKEGRGGFLFSAAFLLGALLAGCASERFARPRPGMTQRGIASWYGAEFHGRPTASGETYDMDGMTAAHKELPLGTRVLVRNLDNGREITVRINDRGPFVRGRILDLSREAARTLGVIGPGTARIELRVLAVGEGRAGPSRFTRYALQVGAYRDRANAEAMLARLRGLGEEARLEVAGDWHRVRIGSYRDEGEAEKARRGLASRGVESVVVGDH